VDDGMQPYFAGSFKVLNFLSGGPKAMAKAK
jgi:hypothetical protein